MSTPVCWTKIHLCFRPGRGSFFVLELQCSQQRTDLMYTTTVKIFEIINRLKTVRPVINNSRFGVQNREELMYWSYKNDTGMDLSNP